MLPELKVVDPRGVRERLMYTAMHCPGPPSALRAVSPPAGVFCSDTLSSYPLAASAQPKRPALPKATGLLSAAAHIQRLRASVFGEDWFLSDCCVLKTQEVLCPW